MTQRILALLLVGVFAGSFLGAAEAPAAAAAADPADLTIIFQKQKDPAQVQKQADDVAAYLSDKLGMPVRAVVPGDYSASVQALVNKRADVAYVSSLPFLLARRDGNAQILLAEQRLDVNTDEMRTDYDSILVVRRDGPVQSVEDLKQNHKDLRFAFTSPTSTSGYIFAYWRLVTEGILKPGEHPSQAFSRIMFGGSYTGALEAVARGQADVAAVSYYTMEGPRADVYLDEETRSKLKVLTRTPGVPTHVLCVRDGLSDDLKARLKAALLELSAEKPELLADVYGAKSLVEVDENKHVQRTIEAVEYLKLPIDDLAK